MAGGVAAGSGSTAQRLNDGYAHLEEYLPSPIKNAVPLTQLREWAQVDDAFFEDFAAGVALRGLALPEWVAAGSSQVFAQLPNVEGSPVRIFTPFGRVQQAAIPGARRVRFLAGDMEMSDASAVVALKETGPLRAMDARKSLVHLGALSELSETGELSQRLISNLVRIVDHSSTLGEFTALRALATSAGVSKSTADLEIPLP